MPKLSLEIPCIVDACESLGAVRQMCRKHYLAAWKRGEHKAGRTLTESVAERFWARTRAMPSGCLEWTGSAHEFGHGQYRFEGRLVGTHRVSWILTFGPIPDGMSILHRCDNPPCVRPDHLFLGDQTDNMQDMTAKGRHWGTLKTHCNHGHEFDPENTRTDSRGHRACRRCMNERNAARR